MDLGKLSVQIIKEFPSPENLLEPENLLTKHCTCQELNAKYPICFFSYST